MIASAQEIDRNARFHTVAMPALARENVICWL
jgi:hypothetical protein